MYHLRGKQLYNAHSENSVPPWNTNATLGKYPRGSMTTIRGGVACDVSHFWLYTTYTSPIEFERCASNTTQFTLYFSTHFLWLLTRSSSWLYFFFFIIYFPFRSIYIYIPSVLYRITFFFSHPYLSFFELKSSLASIYNSILMVFS